MAAETDHLEVLYATDRQPGAGGEEPAYGVQRCRSLAVGTATVRLTDHLTWKGLVRAVRTRHRPGTLPEARIESVRERLRFPETPELPPPADVVEGSPATQRCVAELVDFLETRLEASPRREVVLYVHGFNRRFEEAVAHVAALGDTMGRIMLPLAYSWPAGRTGPLAYAADRESGEFTVFHLKQLLLALARCPTLEAMHLVAHSRGADVLTTALRELLIHARARGDDPRRLLKIRHLVLAAADLDLDVVGQRLAAERLEDACELLTIYSGRGDLALGTARRIFSSKRRVGEIRPGKVRASVTGYLRGHPRLRFIHVPRPSDLLRHGYFVDDPVVLADLVCLLRDGDEGPPGTGRPLRRDESGLWILEPWPTPPAVE